MSVNYRSGRQSNTSRSNLRSEIYNDESPANTSLDVADKDLLAKYNATINADRNRQTKNNGKSRQKKRKSRIKGFLIKLFVLLITVLIAIVFIGWLVSLTLPVKTSFLIMATDQDGTRTDTLMYGVFDKNTKDISLLSIPRDTYVTVYDDVYKKMREDFPQPGSKSMKINAVHHYGGENYGTELILGEVEKITGSKIDFYVKVNFSTFRYIIDAVGGIDFYVPQNMEYHDPLQNLHISLKEGQQHLNGDQAEQVLRFRSGYANADLGRVDVQQQFMKAFITQVFSKGAVLSKPLSFVKLVTSDKYLDTNAGLIDAISYLFVLNGFNTDSIQSDTLPGRATYISGQSVYVYNKEKSESILSEMMN